MLAPWQQEPTGATPAGPPGARSKRVWKVWFADAPPLALKLAAGGAPLATEAHALGWLGRHGCAVPAVLAVSAAAPPTWLALEWCGDDTLDDAAQGASAARLAAFGHGLAAAVAGIEAAFVPLADRWHTSATLRADTRDPAASTPAAAGQVLHSAGDREARRTALREQVQPWLDAAPAALGWLLGTDLPPEIERTLHETLRLAVDAPAGLGSLDYNARNVVLDRRRLAVIDFAAIGVDWPERRFAQYGTATGASSGTFASVLGPASVRAYADLAAPTRGARAGDVAQVVDAHEVLLLLTAAHHLRAADAGEAHGARAAAWRNVEPRRARLLALLRRRLTSGGPADALRLLARGAATGA